jgi:hypothetical protein
MPSCFDFALMILMPLSLNYVDDWRWWSAQEQAQRPLSDARAHCSRRLFVAMLHRSACLLSSRAALRTHVVVRHLSARTLSTVAAPSTVAPSLVLDRLKDPSLFQSACYVNGKWIIAANGASIPVRSPTTGLEIGTIPSLSHAETDSAIVAAHAAFPAWSALPAKARADILLKWHALCIENKQDLGTILSIEQGKPLGEAVGEIVYGAGFFSVYAGEAERINGEVLQPSTPNTRVMTFRQPVGVVAAITPVRGGNDTYAPIASCDIESTRHSADRDDSSLRYDVCVCASPLPHSAPISGTSRMRW